MVVINKTQSFKVWYTSLCILIVTRHNVRSRFAYQTVNHIRRLVKVQGLKIPLAEVRSKFLLLVCYDAWLIKLGLDICDLILLFVKSTNRVRSIENSFLLINCLNKSIWSVQNIGPTSNQTKEFAEIILKLVNFNFDNLLLISVYPQFENKWKRVKTVSKIGGYHEKSIRKTIRTLNEPLMTHESVIKIGSTTITVYTDTSCISDIIRIVFVLT